MTQEDTDRVRTVFDNLERSARLQVDSTAALVGQVHRAAAKNDADRRKKDQPPLRRKTNLRPINEWLPGPVRLSPWQALHLLARAVVLDDHGGGRGLAEHWACLKYCQALQTNSAEVLELSDEGDAVPKRHYKTAQSEELARAFARRLGEHLVQQRYPDHAISTIDADLVLRAGWINAASTRPVGLANCRKYFVEAWRPGEPSKVLLLIAYGTHSGGMVDAQLARAAAHAEFIHIGPYGQLPTLLVSTELSQTKGVTIHAVAAPGEARVGALPAYCPADQNFFPDVLVPGDEESERMPGFQLSPEDYDWFSAVLAHTDAAGLLALSGSVNEAGKYLTKCQGSDRFDRLVMPGASSVCDTDHQIHGHRFVGTDHVFRLHGVRLEVFSGLHHDLHRKLVDGPANSAERVRAYREAAFNGVTTDPPGHGTVAGAGQPTPPRTARSLPFAYSPHRSTVRPHIHPPPHAITQLPPSQEGYPPVR
ncbi:MAG TPA: hypothetical protein VGN37_20595 [Actinocatenispora sp.]